MDNKARIGLFVGGLVLVGMVAYVMLPRTSAKSQAEEASTADPSSSSDFAAGPATQPASTQPIAITDPFAAPAPAATPAIPGSAVAGAGSTGGTSPSVTTLGQSSPAQPAAPADANDAWARALDGGSTTQTRTVSGGLSSHSSLLSDTGTTSTPAAHSGMTSTTPTPKTYKVEAGDSPTTISQKLFGNVKYASKIMAANPSVNAKKLKVGQELTIPEITAKETATGSSVAGTADHTDPVPTAGSSASASSAGSAGSKTYKVLAGDSLQKISTKLYGKSGMWKQIYAANKSKIGSDPTHLRAGMVLQLPEGVQ